jgi:hypothetical protein
MVKERPFSSEMMMGWTLGECQFQLERFSGIIPQAVDQITQVAS